MRLGLFVALLSACHSDSKLISVGLEGDLSIDEVSETWAGEAAEALGEHLAAADLDGDGRMEMVAAGEDRVVRVMPDPLRASGLDEGSIQYELDDELERLRGVHDLDGDGRDELAAPLRVTLSDSEEEEHRHARTDHVVPTRVIALLGLDDDGALSEHAWVEDPHRMELDVSGAVEYFVEGPGDLDGDGFDDLWITQHDSGDDARGRAWLLCGPLIDRAGLSDSVLVVEGPLPWAHLGGEPGGAADWDGDGVVDLAVGGASRSAGALSALSLLHADERGLYVAEDVAFAVLSGDDDTSSISALPGAGDLNGDGHDDLVLRVASSDDSAVLVAWGPISGAGHISALVDGVTDEGWDSLPVANIIGDIDGDGAVDLAFGEPAPADDPGEVTLAYGPVLGHHSVEAMDATLHGGAGGDRVGSALASLGDGDGDGLIDLAVGAPGAEPPGSNARSGAVYAVAGRSR